MTNPAPEQIYQLLANAKTIAVVGASANPTRPSHGIMGMLQDSGYRCIPVNPNETDVLGEKAYASVADIPDAIDIVNVFRRPATTPDVARAAVAKGASVLWLQSGIANDEAAGIAATGGLIVVQDACIAVEHRLLRVPRKPTGN